MNSLINLERRCHNLWYQIQISLQSFFILVEELVQLEQLTDVTLACGDGTNHQVDDDAEDDCADGNWIEVKLNSSLPSFCLHTPSCSLSALRTSGGCWARTGTRRSIISSTSTGSARDICSSCCFTCTGENMSMVAGSHVSMFSYLWELLNKMLQRGDLNPARRPCPPHRNCSLSSSQRWNLAWNDDIVILFSNLTWYDTGLSMATPTMPTGSTTTPKKRTFSTMAGETSPGLKPTLN